MKTILNKRFSAVAGNLTSVALLALAILTSAGLSAAGIRDVAPTAADAPVMLETENLDFGNFASFTSAPINRLIATITSADETMYFGLSAEANADGDFYLNISQSRYQFRVRRINTDGSATVVHGPFLIDNGNANVSDWAGSEYGVYETTATQSGETIFAFTPGQAGEYSIEFSDIQPDVNGRLLIPFWDFTVANAADEAIDGRVWSRSWSFRTPPVTGGDLPLCEWDRAFNGDLYSYTDDGFVSRIDFSDAGFMGLSFDVAFNATGPGTTGDLALDRMSVPNANVTGAAAQYPIFLTLPDESAFPSGECGTVTAADQFSCNGPDDFCLDVSVTNPGQVEVILDFDGNGMLDDNSLDVLLTFEFTDDLLMACIPWDGLRGDGSPATDIDTVDILINYSQGVQHWAVFDVEFMSNGFCVETMRPACAATDNNVLFWDDRNIVEDPGTGTPKDGRNGAACNDVPRAWDFFAIADGQDCTDFQDDETVGYGDKNTLNTYWFANTTVEFRARVPVVSVSIVGNLAICEGGETVLTAVDESTAGVASYLWSGPGVDGAETESVTATQPGEYCVTVTSTNGCISTICVTVEVTDFDEVDFPEDLFICFGDSVQAPIAGSEDLVYSWSPTTGIDDATSNQPTFFPDVTTQFIVTITNQGGGDDGCEAMDTILVTVSPEIGLMVNGGGPICEATASITATTVNTATIELLDADGMVLETVTGTSAQFDVNVSGPADYSVRATNDDDCTEEVSFDVTGGPVDIALPDTIVSCLSQELVLSVENLDPNDTLTYSWSPSDIFVAGTETTDAPEFNGEAGIYDVTLTATNQFNCSTTEVVTLVVIDEDDALSFTSEVDCDGLTVSFTNTSTVGFGYLWLFGDGGFSREENPTYTYSSVGTFNVTLTLIVDQECVADFSTDVTTVESTLVPDFTVGLDGCDGNTGTLNFADATTNLTGGTLMYAWTFTGGTPTTSTDANPMITVEESGTVTASLTVTSSNNCAETTDRSFTVELNEISLTDLTICPGETAELNPGGDGDGRTYTWSPSPDFEADEANPTTAVPGTYSVTVTSTSADFNCESETTITVTESDSINLIINGPDGPLTGPDAPDPGTGGGGGGPGNPDLVLPTVQTCGDPVALMVDLSDNGDNTITVTYTDLDGNPLGDGTGITLSPNGVDTVIVTGTNQFGCTTMDTIAIQNNQVDAAIDADLDGVALCGSIDTSLTVINNRAGDELTYAWTQNDIITGPLDEATVMITTPAEGSVDLMVAVTNQFGCDTTITVTINSQPPPTVSLGDINACAGENAPMLLAEGTFDDDLEYVFEPTDAVIFDSDGQPIFVGIMDQTVTVTVTDPETGCSSSASGDATFRDLTGLNGTADPDTIFVGDVSTLTIAGCEDCGYSWTGPNGSIVPDDAAVVEVTPTEPGDFIYTAEVSSSGCTEEVEIALTVEDPVCDVDRVFVPTAFTPNGDGTNDELRVRSNFGERLTEFRWIIHNRWGQEVYSSDEFSGSWDGTSEGDELEPDVYGYWLRVVCPTGEELIQQGNITILE